MKANFGERCAVVRRWGQWALPLLLVWGASAIAVFGATAQANDTDLLRYHFTVGQTFAYRLEILHDHGDAQECFIGTPIFTVKSVDKGGRTDKAELAAIGRILYGTKSRDDKDFNQQGGQGLWLSTRIVVDTSAHNVGGKKDLTVSTLPQSLFGTVPLKEFFFIELPDKAGQKVGQSGSAMGSITGPPGGIGAGLRLVKGESKYEVATEALSDDLVRVRKEKSFRATEGAPMSVRYLCVGRFDRKRGLLTEADATFSWESGPEKGGPIKMSIRLLDGDDLKAAYDQSVKDFAKLPDILDPFEFRRVRFTPEKDLERVKSAKELKPGLVVAHFHDHEHQWYLAKVVEVFTDTKVTIRLSGSGEEMEVHPGTLMIPPADKLPKK